MELISIPLLNYIRVTMRPAEAVILVGLFFYVAVNASIRKQLRKGALNRYRKKSVMFTVKTLLPHWLYIQNL